MPLQVLEWLNFDELIGMKFASLLVVIFLVSSGELQIRLDSGLLLPYLWKTETQTEPVLYSLKARNQRYF